MKAIRDAMSYIAGSNVVLLGSAPVFNTFRPIAYDAIASVNGSHKIHGLRHVDILFLNTSSLTRKKDVCFRVEEALSTLSCQTRILIDAAQLGPAHPVQAENTIFVSREDRNRFLSEITGDTFEKGAGGNRVPSTGVFAALILRYCGAYVTLNGFSLDDGHALDGTAKRGHVDMDRKYLREIAGSKEGRNG